MKIRTDFVTNSSSSSFTISIEIESKEKNFHQWVQLYPYAEGCDSQRMNMNCNAQQIAQSSSVEELAKLLNDAWVANEDVLNDDDDDAYVDSGGDQWYEENCWKLEMLRQSITQTFRSVDEIGKISLTRTWDTWGEAASCQVYNDPVLSYLSKKLLRAAKEERYAAAQELAGYLNHADIQAEGNWCVNWPTGFLGASAEAIYDWRDTPEDLSDLPKDDQEMVIENLEKLATSLLTGYLEGDDCAYETTDIYMRSGEIAHKAVYPINTARQSRYSQDPRPLDLEYDDQEIEEYQGYRYRFEKKQEMAMKLRAARTLSIADASSGDIVMFGSDPKPNPENYDCEPVLRETFAASGGGPFPLFWYVNKRVDDRVLLCMVNSIYTWNGEDEPYDHHAWKKSEMRKWYHSVFLQGAFTEEERQQIIPVLSDAFFTCDGRSSGAGVKDWISLFKGYKPAIWVRTKPPVPEAWTHGPTSITLPDTVTYIAERAFEFCTGLQEVVLPDSLKRIGQYAFYCCTNLEKVTIPESVQSLQRGIFEGCEKLTIYGTAGSTAETYAAENGIRFQAI